MQYGLNSNTIALPGRIAGFTRTYYGACLDDSGVFCFAGTKTGEMIVFNIQSAIFKHSFQVSSNGVLSICTSGDAVYVGSGDGKVKKLRGNDVKWETEKEVQLAGKITSLSLSSDSQTLYAGTDSGSIYTISASDLRSTLLEESHVRSVVMVGFDEDDSEVFCTASQDGTIRLWDLTDYSIVTLVSAASEATCAIYRNKKIISGWADGFVRCFDAKSEKLDWKINNAHRGGVTCIASNAQYICTGGNDSTIRLWNWRQEYVAQFNDHTKPVTSILIDCNQPNLIHSASLDKTVQTYDLKQNKRIKYHSVSDKNSLGFNWISQRKDSEYEIISAGVDGKLLMWDIDYPDYQGMLLDPNKSQLKCCSVSPSGRYLATSGDDQLIKVWDLKTNKVIGQGVCHSMDVLGVQWSPDERQLVSVGADCAICVWNFYI
jgi:WD40 repeat protein